MTRPSKAKAKGPKVESAQTRYRRVKREVLAERGEVCEACGAPAKHVHHLVPCSETGIASELVYDPRNLIILCDDCHALQHPGFRSYDWGGARVARGRRLGRMG